MHLQGDPCVYSKCMLGEEIYCRSIEMQLQINKHKYHFSR